jgi:uncharacterized protein involved in cysteine biosynthesis
VFIYAAVILFVIDKAGILDAVKNVLSPVINGLLGLPVQMVDALILCMARHEAAAGLIIKLIEAGKLNYIQCIVAVTITTMFVPRFGKPFCARSRILVASIILCIQYCTLSRIKTLQKLTRQICKKQGDSSYILHGG